MEIVNAIVEKPLARNTVMTTLGVLERKGYVKHRSEGRTFMYSAAIKEDTAQGDALSDVLRRFFSGSAEQLVVRLLDVEPLSDADRKRIQGLIQAMDDDR